MSIPEVNRTPGPVSGRGTGAGAGGEPARARAMGPPEVVAEVAQETRAEATNATRSGNAPPEVDVAQTVERLNQLIQNVRRELHFSVDDASGDTIIKVIDAETREVVRQIPADEVLNLAERLQTTGRLLADVHA